MAYSEEVKEEIKARLAKGEKVVEISKKTGISMATIYKWKKESKQKEKTVEEPEIKNKKEEKNEFKENIKVEITTQVPKTVVTKNKPKEVDHFYGIMKYLDEKRRILYTNMQSTNYQEQTKGISQWDKMEELIEKVNENRDNKEYLDQLYAKISHLQELEKGMDR